MTSEHPRHDKLSITGNFEGQEVNLPLTIIEEWGRRVCLIGGQPIDAALIAEFDHILKRILVEQVRTLAVVLEPNIEHTFQDVRTFIV